jgi:orotate phosphoribosyltransferase
MNDEVIEILKKTKAIYTDSHFVGTSGRHMSAYINKDALYPHSYDVSRIAELFAEKHKDEEIDVVLGPAIGGAILGTWTAFHLSKLKNKEILSVYTEKDKGTSASNAESNQIFKRGYDKLVEGKSVLIVEDLTTTGGSVKKAANAVKDARGTVAAICVMVNRDSKLVTSESVGAPFSSLAVYEFPSYTEEECPLCKDGVPVNTTVGHGKKFLEEQAKNKDN